MYKIILINCRTCNTSLRWVGGTWAHAAWNKYTTSICITCIPSKYLQIDFPRQWFWNVRSEIALKLKSNFVLQSLTVYSLINMAIRFIEVNNGTIKTLIINCCRSHAKTNQCSKKLFSRENRWFICIMVWVCQCYGT